MGTAPLHDIERDAWLALRGIRVVRIPACLIFEDMDAPLRVIEAAARGDH